jgi:hypothetical protein
MQNRRTSQWDAFRKHLLAWCVPGLACGWSLMPVTSIGTLVGFGISGLILAMVLGSATYPVSRQPVLILVGTSAGAVLGYVVSGPAAIATSPQVVGQCLLMGGLIGASAKIWQVPLYALRLPTCGGLGQLTGR